MAEGISALLTTLASLGKIGGELASANDSVQRNKLLLEFQAALISSNGAIATVQAQNATLTRENEDLRKEAVRCENWPGESKRYAMHDAANGLVVYALKESVCGGEPPHYLCANCFNEGKKTVLFFSRVPGNSQEEALFCKDCKTYSPTGYSGGNQPKYAKAT